MFVKGSGSNKSCVGINGGVYYVIPWLDGFKGLAVCVVSGGERVHHHSLTITPDDGRKLRPKHVEL